MRAQGEPIPGIALSGYGQEGDIRRSQEAGFAAHLTKPTNPEQLAEAIGRVVASGEAAGHLPVPDSAPLAVSDPRKAD